MNKPPVVKSTVMLFVALFVGLTVVALGVDRILAAQSTQSHRQPKLTALRFLESGEPNGARAVSAVDGRLVAEFTDGSRTVVIHGPHRVFRERLLPEVGIATDTWIRVLPHAWKSGSQDSEWFAEWYRRANDWNIDDALAISFQYVDGAPDFYDDKGVRYRGNASFGPLSGNGRTREVGGDFYDYLGIDWTFPDGTVREAQASEAGNVDCSGFLRLVFGYRLGMPLTWNGGPTDAIPRVADDIGKRGPGVLLAGNHEDSRKRINALRPGDLVFFDTDGDDHWNHSGIFVGTDLAGDYRFVSSRGTANGPTIADVGGESLLDGDGMYARGLVGIRRL